MIKAVAPQMACNVIDRAIQVHGAAGVSDDFPLARLYGWHRAMRLFDGPDEVHMRTHRPRRTRPREERVRRGGDVVVASTDGDLSGAWNFRDVAEETGIRPGRFFRSSELSRLDDGRPCRRCGGSASPTSPTCGRCARSSGAGRARCPTGSRCTCCRSTSCRISRRRGAEAPHEQAFERMMTEKPDDEDVAVAAKRFMIEEYERFPTLPGAQSGCAPGHFDAGRRAARHHALLRRQGPDRVHRRAGAGDRRRAARCDPGRLPAQQRRRCRSCASASSSRSATAPRTTPPTRSSRSPRRGSPRRCSACARSTWPRRERTIDAEYGSTRRITWRRLASPTDQVARLDRESLDSA